MTRPARELSDVQLWLSICTLSGSHGEQEFFYNLEYLAGGLGWRFRKRGEPVYDVDLSEYGPTCDCPDFLVRRANTREGCKHIEALRWLGLLPDLGDNDEP
jgi:hypothetical protein